jgi:hypothetical protein
LDDDVDDDDDDDDDDDEEEEEEFVALTAAFLRLCSPRQGEPAPRWR